MEKTILEQCIRQGRPIPDKIQNAPELELGLSLYYTGFYDLDSSRQIGGMSPGSIPWTAIQMYCVANGIEGEQREDFFYHVMHLDKVCMKYSASKADKSKATPPKVPKRGTRG